jgi:cysteine desulfurase/selenocysteine lyase
MIGEVTVERTTWADIPARFEAGTPPIAEVISFTDTLEKLANLHADNDVAEAERTLYEYAVEKLSRCAGVKLVGPVERDQESIISFLVNGVHPHDMATIADSHGVQVRAGHHCVMPAMRALELPATTRLSFGLYSVQSDIDRLVEAIGQAKSLFG